MLVTLAAIQLLALGQTKVADPPQAPEPPQEATPAQAQPAPQGAAPREAPAAPAEPPASPRPGTKAASAPPTHLSLLSAEPLAGGSASLVWAGWSTIGAMWGQGVTPQDDLGALIDLDWTTTEMRLGGWYRRPLGSSGAFQLAGRLGLAWYADFAGRWVHDVNHGDRGVQLVPALIMSARGGGGIFSVTLDLPITVTVWHDGGVLFQPRASVAYEAALYDPLTLGIRAGFGARAGSGTAPIPATQGVFELVVLAGWRLL